VSYNEYEVSKDKGLPASLFLIEYGDTDDAFFAYTDADETITYDAKSFVPIAIGRDKMEASGNLDKTALTIQLTPKASIVQLYKGQIPSHPIRLTIFQGHVEDGNFQVVWTGRIISIGRKPPWAELTCEPISTAMRKPGLRRHYQYGCPWVLYGPECRALKSVAKVEVVPTDSGDNYVEFGSGWEGAFARNKFLNGYLQWADSQTGILQTRTIIAFGSTNDQLVINGSIWGIDDQTVTAYLGCNHQLSDCENLHNNVINFGGMPWIPKENPTRLANQFY
tara:strand:- start:5754 stop:6590 length:837 start_codon:yes stop_codon:yes gene_type:complete